MTPDKATKLLQDLDEVKSLLEEALAIEDARLRKLKRVKLVMAVVMAVVLITMGSLGVIMLGRWVGVL